MSQISKILGRLALSTTLLIAVMISPLAHAGGGSVVGNGGGALVCFKGDASNFVEEGLLKKRAAQAIVSASVLEFYIEAATRDVDPMVLQYVLQGNDRALVNLIWMRMGQVPEFHHQVVEAAETLVEMNAVLGDLLSADYHDTHDWSSPVAFSRKCARVQTAVRFDSFLYVEPVIWAVLPLVQKQMIRFHEYIYFVGTKFHGMQSSRPTQDILTYLLSNQFTPAGLKAHLKHAGFSN